MLDLTPITTFLAAGGGNGLIPAWFKDTVNAATKPEFFLTLTTAVFIIMLVAYKWWTKPLIAGVLFVLFLVFYFGSLADPNFKAIIVKPDNVPITMMVITVM